jgi:hypothetical protein
MMSYATQFEISQLRQQNVVKMVESLAVFVLCLFTTAFLPQLLYKYFYANAQLTAEPPIFGYISLGSFVVGVLYFLYCAFGNYLRSMKVRRLEKELLAMDDECCGNCKDVSMIMPSAEGKSVAVKMMRKAASKRKPVAKKAE